MTNNDTLWNTNLDLELLKLYVGQTYSSIEEVAVAKSDESTYVRDYLDIMLTDNVMDIGQGQGFIASFIAPHCNKLTCVDISNSFLQQSKKLLNNFDNVEHALIKRGDLSAFNNLDKIYALAVFIHFNIYDIAIYLESIYSILKPGGKFLFDFLDADYLELDDEVFNRHKNRYMLDKNTLETNINYNSKTAVENICKHLGFSVTVMRENTKHPLLLLTKDNNE